MSYNIKLEGKNLIEAENLIVKVATILDKNNFDYTLDGGTILGIVRENRLLPWDNDIDFSILNPKKESVDTILKILKTKGFRIRLRYFEKDYAPYFKKGGVRMIKIRNKKFFGLLKGNVCLDIFVKYQHEDNFYWLIGNNVIKSVPKSFYEVSDKIKFQNYSYPIPANTEEYLSYRYGNWQEPKKDWSTFSHDKAII